MQGEIDRELARIGANHESLGPCSSVCAIVGPDEASGVPAGYVRYYDDHAEGFAKTERFLAALQELPDNYCQTCEGTEFWGAFPIDLLPDEH